jgi:hypothetical protein
MYRHFRRDEDQCFHGRLPLGRHVFRLRQLGDVVAGVAQCFQSPAIW